MTNLLLPYMLVTHIPFGHHNTTFTVTVLSAQSHKFPKPLLGKKYNVDLFLKNAPRGSILNLKQNMAMENWSHEKWFIGLILIR